jgi:hypothetical protein
LVVFVIIFPALHESDADSSPPLLVEDIVVTLVVKHVREKLAFVGRKVFFALVFADIILSDGEAVCALSELLLAYLWLAIVSTLSFFGLFLHCFSCVFDFEKFVRGVFLFALFQKT